MYIQQIWQEKTVTRLSETPSFVSHQNTKRKTRNHLRSCWQIIYLTKNFSNTVLPILEQPMLNNYFMNSLHIVSQLFHHLYVSTTNTIKKTFTRLLETPSFVSHTKKKQKTIKVIRFFFLTARDSHDLNLILYVSQSSASSINTTKTNAHRPPCFTNSIIFVSPARRTMEKSQWAR